MTPAPRWPREQRRGVNPHGDPVRSYARSLNCGTFKPFGARQSIECTRNRARRSYSCRSSPKSGEKLSTPETWEPENRSPEISLKQQIRNPFRVPDLPSLSFANHSLWAKGDLNPHVPKDTGT